MINMKKCKRCGELFDIDTSQDWCPECRKPNKLNEEKEYEIYNKQVMKKEDYLQNLKQLVIKKSKMK